MIPVSLHGRQAWATHYQGDLTYGTRHNRWKGCAMNSYGYGHQPASHGWRRYSWIITLVVGVGLGALLVGPIGGQLWFLGGHGDRAGMARRSGQPSQVTIPTTPQQNPATAADTTQQQTGPRQADQGTGTVQQPRGGDARGWADQAGAHDRRGGRSGGFFPFAQRGLLVPLLLIGAGAWLIWGRRNGPGNGGGSGNSPRPAGPVEPATTPYDRAETGETRRL